MIKWHAQLLKNFPFSFFLSFFLSFLVLTYLYQSIVGVEVILTIYHTHTHTRARAGAVGLLRTRNRSVEKTSSWKHTTVIRDEYPYPRWDTNPQSQLASGPRPTPQSPGHRDWPQKFPAFNTSSKFSAVDRTACQWLLSCGTLQRWAFVLVTLNLPRLEQLPGTSAGGG
jgi:hypothetical protein